MSCLLNIRKKHKYAVVMGLWSPCNGYYFVSAEVLVIGKYHNLRIIWGRSLPIWNNITKSWYDNNGYNVTNNNIIQWYYFYIVDNFLKL